MLGGKHMERVLRFITIIDGLDKPAVIERLRCSPAGFSRLLATARSYGCRIESPKRFSVDRSYTMRDTGPFDLPKLRETLSMRRRSR
jgi:hypothetical protein